MDSQTIDRIVGLGSEARTVHEDAFSKTVALSGKLNKVDKAVPRRQHAFETLPGLLEYLTGPRSGDGPGVIFVGDNEIVAELDYLAEVRQKATLSLSLAEEYAALIELTRGVQQKSLWRLLLTKLDGCLPFDLFSQISNLNVKIDGDAEVSISRIGTDAAKSATAIRITYTDPKGKSGSQSRDLTDKWVWTGRIWESYEKQFQIDLTMEVDTKSMVFTFHPRRLELALRMARLDLVDAIRRQLEQANCNRFTVHEGKF